MVIARQVEMIASSPLGWEEAVQEGLNRANKTLRNIGEIEIISQKVKVEGGRIVEYRVRMILTFYLDEWSVVGHW